MALRALAALALCVVALGACGGGDETPDRASRPAPQPAPPTAPRGPTDLPAGIPREAKGPADPADVRVIRLWSDALRRSDVEGASALWAVPSKVQNGTPVLTLATLADVRLFNDSLSCGSRLVSALGAPGGFTIAVFELTGRPGADCGPGVGSDARTAIVVRAGRIAEWYRLPADPDAPEPEPAPRVPAPEPPQPQPAPEAPEGSTV